MAPKYDCRPFSYEMPRLNPIQGVGSAPPLPIILNQAGGPPCAQLGGRGEAPCLLFSIINKSQGEREKSIISFDFLQNRRDPMRDPTGSAVARYHELCFSLGFGAFYATGS